MPHFFCTPSSARATYDKNFPIFQKTFFSLAISNLQKDICRYLQIFAVSRKGKIYCINFVNENENCHPEGKRREAKVIVIVIVIVNFL